MTEFIRIGDRKVGVGLPPYVVAEACINHQGDPEMAKQMVYVAHAMGCDAIKFQIHVLDDEMLHDAPQSNNFDEPLYDTLEKTNLNLDVHRELNLLCSNLGNPVSMHTVFQSGVDLLMDLGVQVFKVGSGELTNILLQMHIASKGVPMVISTGMATEDEIFRQWPSSKTLEPLLYLRIAYPLTRHPTTA